jgi:sugar/nucleoside kinase (ribokinase family)
MKESIGQVIIGDLAFQKTITPHGERDEVAGSAFYCAIAASTIAEVGTVGVIARIGEDFDLAPLQKRGINTQGVAIIRGGQTARFFHTENADRTRNFVANFGVAATVDLTQYPDEYKMATWVHLSTSEPAKQLKWINHLKQIMPHIIISADAFEKFAKELPELSYQVMQAVDLFFLNEEELSWLQKFYPRLTISKAVILKKGENGAEYIDPNYSVTVSSPKVKVVDTTGAGETLATVYMVLRCNGATIESALKQAAQLASKEVTAFGIEHLSP